MEKFKDKKIAILGFGVEGQSVCDFLKNSKAAITVFDEKKKENFKPEVLSEYEKRGVIFRFGKIEDIIHIDYIFRSPGFHPDLLPLRAAKEKGVEITSATKLFFELCPCPIIGVTGTKGKGTTSTLIYEILKKQGFDAFLGGNIGTPPLSFLSRLKKDSKVVLELSSFQLIDLTKSPHIAVMLMTTSEHLNYHKDIYEYIDAKRNLLRHQDVDDFAIVNRDYPASNESDIETAGRVYKVSREQEVMQGCFIKDDSIYLKMDAHEEMVMSVKDVSLPGKHNLENICAAIVASLVAGANMKSIVPVLKAFKGLEHRIEFVESVRGVGYYDDSFSTTPETAIAAIESFEEPKILLLGGSSKNSDFAELGEVISNSNSIKAIISIGKEWEKIKERIMNHESGIMIIEDQQDMEEAVREAARIGDIGDVVLLSPGCASFDRYKNYKDRGEKFKEAVFQLTN